MLPGDLGADGLVVERSWRPRRDSNPCYRRESEPILIDTGNRVLLDTGNDHDCPTQEPHKQSELQQQSVGSWLPQNDRCERASSSGLLAQPQQPRPPSKASEGPSSKCAKSQGCLIHTAGVGAIGSGERRKDGAECQRLRFAYQIGNLSALNRASGQSKMFLLQYSQQGKCTRCNRNPATMLKRNSFYGPTYVDVDVDAELSKSTRIHDRFDATFLAEAINVADHANFAPAGINV
jgi:hypothetical protein